MAIDQQHWLSDGSPPAPPTLGATHMAVEVLTAHDPLDDDDDDDDDNDNEEEDDA